MRHLFFIILLSCIILCCKKKQTVVDEEYQPIQILCQLSNNLDTIRFYIKGNWEWLQEKRADRVQQKFVYLTPKTEGYSLTLALGNDTARFYKNNLPDSVYTYKVVRLAEISGTSFPEDSLPVLVFYNLYNGMRNSHVPIKICSNYMLLQYQYVSSIVGEDIWKKQ